jgi:hypothetical protein
MSLRAERRVSSHATKSACRKQCANPRTIILALIINVINIHGA